jgi:hypothetical protein
MFKLRSQNFGHGEKRPLPKSMELSIRRQHAGLATADLTQFTFESRDSTYKGASADFIIYDDSGRPILFGRQVGPSMGFWTYRESDAQSQVAHA